MPNPSTFPFTKISVELSGGGSFEIKDAKLLEALQYSGTNGLPSLLAHLEVLRRAYHSPTTALDSPAADIERTSLISTGSQDALSKTFGEH